MQILLILTLGVLTGIMSGLLGVGGGLIMVPAFTYIFKMSIHKAIGTSLAVMIPLALVGSFKHFLGGNVELKNVLFFAAAAIIGGWFGATLAQALPAVLLRKIFAVFLVVVAVNMFFKS